MMKYLLITFFIVNISISLFSQSIRRHNAFSGSVVLSLEGGTAIAATDYVGSHPDYMGKFSLEFFFPSFTSSSFGLRFFGNNGFLSEEEEARKISLFRTNFTTAGAGIVYSLNASDFVSPYLFAGIGYLWFEPKDENGIPIVPAEDFNKSEINYMGELGLRFLLTDNFSFNISTGLQISPNDYWDASKEGTNNDLMVQVLGGFSFAILSQTDTDLDGVSDNRDLCPGTPGGIEVDGTGCPKDLDKDGVPDYKDKCLKTPLRIPVDENGCPMDTDKDGVPDYIDVCPGTPADNMVDKSGCPIDKDGDKVADDEDKCPDTPKGALVDRNGCPKDDDLDGIPDYLDKCPKTPAGEKVNEEGCSIKGDVVRVEKGIKEVVLSSAASFASGSTTILPPAHEELNKLLYSMKEDPLSRWRIEGYTDNVGSEASNKRISLKRAQAVLDYFVSRGISSNRFEIVGNGEANPVASNETEAGRSKNRRVRIVRIN